MLHSCIDHIVTTAPSLEEGAEYLQTTLGIAPETGGEHPRMGTHNQLLKLGNDLYLEVIAVNPKALPPDRPRWFQLDNSDWNRRPQLATWVVRTNDIYAATAASPVPHGCIEAMTRGALDWLITIPKEGSLPLQGMAPTLIQWNTQPHPASKLQDKGCSLIGLEVFHAEAEKLKTMLDRIAFQGELVVSQLAEGLQPYLIAHIQTPEGTRQLGGTGT